MKATSSGLLVLALAATTAGAQTGPSCTAPALEVEISGMSRGPDAGGALSAFLHVEDPNPASQVTGYNIYSSADPSLPRSHWELVAVNVTDADPGAPGLQVEIPNPRPDTADVFFFLVTAYNFPCALEGPWKVSKIDDFDGDGDGAEDDPCPTTPPGAAHLVQGCSATDLLLRPEVLVGPADEGIDAFVAENGGAGVPIPDTVQSRLDAAKIALVSAFEEFRDAKPCPAAASYGNAVAQIDGAVLAIEEYLAELTGGGPPAAPPGAGTGDDDGTEGPIEWPSAEVLHWQGQLFVLSGLDADAAQSSAIADQVCAAEGPAAELQGRVVSISDEKRLVELESGERVVLAWSALQGGSDRLATDLDVAFQGHYYGGVLLGQSYFPLPTSTYGWPELTYDGCLKLRVLPIQPLWTVPQSSWVRHDPDGYANTNGRLELEVGDKFIADDHLCPGVLADAGPSGQDVRLDYFFEISLSYMPKPATVITNQILTYELDGSYPVSLPGMDPLVDGALVATRLKRTCLRIDLLSPWNCSAPQPLDSTTYPIRVRPAHGYCSANYTATNFDIEDHEPGDWRPTQVQSVTTPGILVPDPVTFSARGDRIVDGQPVHTMAVGLNQPFAIYNPFGHYHAGLGTDERSFLDWPHVEGTRNGQPFRYSCSVPALVTDVIDYCGGPWTFYRLPFPGGFVTHVNQGNGGAFSHNGWQMFALDLSGTEGNPLRAARGGTVIRVRVNMTLNCLTQTCMNFGFPLLDEYGSHVAIQHQDGTVGWYAHMVPYTAAVVPTQKVKRGAYLGQLGNTGNSTGSHVHYHVTPENPSQWGNTTVPSSYEAFSHVGQAVLSCMVPQQGQFYTSTNLN